MASDQAFVIDDILSTTDNQAAYVQVLERMDSALGTTLGQYLMLLAAAEAPDTTAIWDALYSVSAVTDRDILTGGQGAAV
jgi:hypothetical protein